MIGVIYNHQHSLSHLSCVQYAHALYICMNVWGGGGGGGGGKIVLFCDIDINGLMYVVCKCNMSWNLFTSHFKFYT